MPAPVAIRDPATYYESQKDPSTALGFGEDPVAPLRDFLSMSTEPKDSVESSQNKSRHLDDISISPRLFGYFTSFVSSTVCTISSTIFFFRGVSPASADGLDEYASSIGLDLTSDEMELAKQRIGDMTNTYHIYFGTGGNLVQEYKIYGCIAISGLLTLMTMAIVIAHFDSFCCVTKNRISFRDGSKIERNLLLTLIVLSVVGLFTSTGKFSVGEAQANVFFSTWTTFVVCVANYELWRKGSGKDLSFQKVLSGQKRHWFLLAIFSTITFLSTLDFFLSNNIVQNTHQYECMELGWTNQWMLSSMVGCIACWGMVLIHRYCKPVLAVRILEFVLSMAITGVYGYVVAALTGGNLDQVPCPSNLYFSVWGAFFLSVWILGTMIQEGVGAVQDES